MWAVAIRSSPLTIQFVLGLLFILLWFMGWSRGWPATTRADERTNLLAATTAAALIGVAVGAALVTRPRLTLRGVGFGVLGSSAVTLIGGVGFVLWLW
ncbi:hypothetical protein CIW49_26985 [Mycolicibacterium sp. P1-18]|nr:hypothetical protein CIW49_26985 [Mycolicibacterium sp. P1-18]